MKKLLLGLVLVNIIYYVYAHFKVPEKEEIIVYRGEKGVPLLVTLDELDRPPAVSSHVPIEVDARAIRNKSSADGAATVDAAFAVGNEQSSSEASPPQAAQKDSDSKPAAVAAVAPVTATCQTIGPFADLAVARASRLSLERADIDVKNRKETEEIKGAYWVYLPAYESKEQARAASKVLADNGVKDYFIISDEDNRNGISLGLYNQKSGSERRRSDIAKLGFEPRIARKERQRDYWWLDIQPKASVQDEVWRVDGTPKETKLIARKCEA